MDDGTRQSTAGARRLLASLALGVVSVTTVLGLEALGDAIRPPDPPVRLGALLREPGCGTTWACARRLADERRLRLLAPGEGRWDLLGVDASGSTAQRRSVVVVLGRGRTRVTMAFENEAADRPALQPGERRIRVRGQSGRYTPPTGDSRVGYVSWAEGGTRVLVSGVQVRQARFREEFLRSLQVSR